MPVPQGRGALLPTYLNSTVPAFMLSQAVRVTQRIRFRLFIKMEVKMERLRDGQSQGIMQVLKLSEKD